MEKEKYDKLVLLFPCSKRKQKQKMEMNMEVVITSYSIEGKENYDYLNFSLYKRRL
jgi:uncharacterized protein YifN (PemK superfamily)